VRTLLRALATSVLALVGFVGPASAATMSNVVAQAGIAQGTLTGKITDARGTPLAGAAVTVSGAGTTRSATTAGDGTFSFTLPPGLYSIVINHGGYQSVQNDDIAVVAGSAANLTIPMAESSTQTLQTIGRVSTSGNRNPINTNVSAVSTLNANVIAERVPTNLNDVVTELPGVSIARTTGATANSFFVTRGFYIQQKVNVDGHPVASGQFGNWNTNYASPFIFDQIEVLKGAGLNGPTAGESAIGTINLRTRDFTPRNTFEATAGIDSFSGSYLNLFGSANLLNNKLSVLAARTSSGYNGPWNNVFTNRVGTVSGLPVGTYQPPSPNGLIQFQGDLSNRYNLEAELAKIRYRFSENTSVTAEYLGLQGQYFPQGGAYASYYGKVNVGYCANGTTIVFDPTKCNTTSAYNAPYAASLAGSMVDAYQWFPNSYVQNNEPQFSAELRTTLKNDTILIRPYAAEINRFINGQYEVLYPGNNGQWFQVTNAANCQVAFQSPTTANGGVAKGPCFGQNAQYNSPAYIGGAANPHSFSTTTAAPTCTTANPCWTTSTAQSNDGSYNYGTPFSQPERDYLHGVTFSYVHPVGENVYNFSYDYNNENSTFYSGDLNPAPAGCSFVIGSGQPNAAGKPNYQPTCPLSFLPKTGLGYAPTNIRKNDFSLTGQFQLTPRLQLAVGNYLTIYHPDAQIEDPSVLNQYQNLGAPLAAPLQLVHVGKGYTHYDPHFGLEYRANRDLVLRATAGSSITDPYASIISGIDRVDPPNGANSNTYTLTRANSNLLPETQVSYDLGGDLRLGDGGVLSADVYSIAIHDAFAANNVALTGPALIAAQCAYPGASPVAITVSCPSGPVTGGGTGSGYFVNQTINVGALKAYGLEVSLRKNPLLGYGYYVSGSLERAFYDQISPSIYLGGQTPLINGKQLDGSILGTGSVPYLKTYAELSYAFVRDGLISVGADYEGFNNSTYGPPYTLFNATIRVPVANGWPLEFAIDNLLAYSTGTALGRALQNQGSQTVRYGCKSDGTNCTYSTSAKSLQFVYPRNVRIQLSHRF